MKFLCIDINECTKGLHTCEHNCNNNVGSYTCSCDDGYDLDENGRTCTGM